MRASASARDNPFFMCVKENVSTTSAIHVVRSFCRLLVGWGRNMNSVDVASLVRKNATGISPPFLCRSH